MKLLLHQTHHTIGDFNSIYHHLTQKISEIKKEGPTVHLFPELFLTGYPLQDLCLYPDFVQNYHMLLENIANWGKKNLEEKEIALLGGLKYTFCENKRKDFARSFAQKIENGIYFLSSNGLEFVYSKCLLPSYDIFDESKYFQAGNECTIFSFQGKNIALQICEDMWASSLHQIDPVLALANLCKEKNISLDVVVNLSASPFNLFKQESRIKRGKNISQIFNVPFLYVNRIGGEDEILFDGQSFVAMGDTIQVSGKIFESDLLSYQLPENKFQLDLTQLGKEENTWESLFKHRLDLNNNNGIKLKSLGDQGCHEILKALIFGFREYATKSKHQKFTVALSGGIDSGLVLSILKLALRPEQGLEAIYMPGLFSASLSYDLCETLCQNLNIPLYTFPIKFLHSTIKNQVKENFKTDLTGIADENIQSRLRGALIYLRANQTGSLVLNTSNKSELAVGYSTQYGDSVGALSILGDLYKSEVFELAKYINRQFGPSIPTQMIERAPTAELRADQRDDQSLPPYEILDPILEGLLSLQFSIDDLIELGLPKEDCLKVHQLFLKSEYKRFQFCPIIKVHSKSFGIGHRLPICKQTKNFEAN